MRVSHSSFVASGLATYTDNWHWLPVHVGRCVSVECVKRPRSILRYSLQMLMARRCGCLCHEVVHAHQAKDLRGTSFWN
jgi:hypothetical protein